MWVGLLHEAPRRGGSPLAFVVGQSRVPELVLPLSIPVVLGKSRCLRNLPFLQPGSLQMGTEEKYLTRYLA